MLFALLQRIQSQRHSFTPPQLTRELQCEQGALAFSFESLTMGSRQYRLPDSAANHSNELQWRHDPGFASAEFKLLSTAASVSDSTIWRQPRVLGEIAGVSAYSDLNACIGSRRDARHAGTIHANAAAVSRVAATAA